MRYIFLILIFSILASKIAETHINSAQKSEENIANYKEMRYVFLNFDFDIFNTQNSQN
jgi:hypothetical protein